MISCYFISLMKIHKKQNGQLARPSILQVLTVSFWRAPFSGRWAGPTVNCGLPSEVPSLRPCPRAPCHAGFDASHVSSASAPSPLLPSFSPSLPAFLLPSLTAIFFVECLLSLPCISFGVGGHSFQFSGFSVCAEDLEGDRALGTGAATCSLFDFRKVVITLNLSCSSIHWV